MAHSLGDLLGDVIARYRLQHVLDEVRVPEYWTQIVGPRLARVAVVRSFENGILRVHVSSAVWRQELVLRRDELRTSLNARIGRDVVQEIIVR